METRNPTPVKLYVAAASGEIDRCEAFLKAVRSLRHDCDCAGAVGPAGEHEPGCASHVDIFESTHDWCPDVRDAMKSGIPERQLPSSRRIASAAADVRGVLDSDIFVLLAPEKGSFGAGFEFALACTRPDIIVVTSGIGSIFTEYTDARFDSDAATLTALPHLAIASRNASAEWYKRNVAKRRAALFCE